MNRVVYYLFKEYIPNLSLFLIFFFFSLKQKTQIGINQTVHLMDQVIQLKDYYMIVEFDLKVLKVMFQKIKFKNK